MDYKRKKELIEYLYEFSTEKRQNTFNQVIKNRTRHITVVLEDIYQPHNASAVLRTCDLFGVQDVHIIENKNKYKVNPNVALGSSKWLNLNFHNKNDNNTLPTFDYLREKGYKIVATSPHKDGYDLGDLPLNDKIALVFGTELQGLSDTALENADMYVKIPMYGFTESFNISVSASIILHHLIEKMRKEIKDWGLSENEKTDILLKWIKNTVKMSKELEEHFMEKR